MYGWLLETKDSEKEPTHYSVASIFHLENQ
jgi:hypothetical protein